MLSVRRRDSAIARYVRARAATSATCEYLSTRTRNWLRASANRPLANSLCARSKARRAADSSCVGGRGGGGGADAGLTALTAASFCVFLTRVFTFATATFFAAALRANGFAAAFFVLVAGFAFGADFFAALSLADLAGFRADAFAVTALLAL